MTTGRTKIRINIVGTQPLLMHSTRLVDPLDPIKKEIGKITAKRKKTDEDHIEIARIEHAAGLYHHVEYGPYIPGQNIEKCIVEAARITRQGKSIERGVFIETNINPLVYDGPRDVKGLWEDENFRHTAAVVISRQRVMRCRPQFRQWVTSAEGSIDLRIIDLEAFREIVDTAGQMIGLGDWRPRYGRFTAEVEEIK